MKKAFLTFVCVLSFLSTMSAIGYTSAFVETEHIMAERARSADGFTTKGLDDMFGSSGGMTSTSTRATYNTLQMAAPALDPMTETTTKLIYGMMDVILSRFKQQLFISSVAQWREELLKSDVQFMFPHLSELLENSDSKNFLSSYELWKSAIDLDLQETPIGVLNFTLHILEKTENLRPEEKALMSELRMLMVDIYAFRNVSSLDEFILLSTSEVEEHSNFTRLIGIIAKNMLDDSGEFVLYDLTEKVQDPDWLTCYLETIKADVDRVIINNDSFQVTAASIRYYLDSCMAVESFFDQLNPASGTANASQSSSSGYMKLYLTTCDKLLVLWSHMKTGATNNWDSYYNIYTDYRFQIIDMGRQIDRKDYKGLLNTLITTSLRIASDHEYIAIPYSRFLSLISAIALNSDSEEVNYRDIMDSILEPVGGFAYKRESSFTVALNSYPGLGGGAEMLDYNVANAKGVGGLACPVGLEINWGKKVPAFKGIFLSAFDLGAVASYRFTASADSTDAAPMIGWKQLVSPGLYILLQKADHPVTLGLGVQITPQLRKVTEEGVVLEKNAIRLGAFISLDIPVLTFYVKHDWSN